MRKKRQKALFSEFCNLDGFTKKVVGRAGLTRFHLACGQRLRVVVSLRSARTYGSHPALLHYIFHFESGGPCWIRTSDQLIKSQLLYQLS